MMALSLALVKLGCWRARWDLNPGSPPPQGGVIIRTRLRAPTTGLYTADIKGRIVKTLL